jgi:hypothetical protein
VIPEGAYNIMLLDILQVNWVTLLTLQQQTQNFLLYDQIIQVNLAYYKLCSALKIKVKFTLKEAMNDQKGSRGIALLFHEPQQ